MILITGAQGNIGYALVKTLVKQGVKVRAVVLDDNASGSRFRPPGIAQTSDFPAGVEVYSADLRNPETLLKAFDGISGIFINPRAVGDSIANVLTTAKSHGVKRVVTLSASNVDEDLSRQPSRLNGDKNKEVEAAVMASGMEWTALRSTFYAINTVGFWAGQIKAGDTVYGPYATWENSPVDEQDVAEVAAHAFLHDDLIGQRPIMSGPQSLSQAEMVSVIGKTINRPLVYQEIPADAAKIGMIERGFSEAFVDSFLALCAEDAGKPALVSSDIEAILRRPAHTFAEWTTKHLADFQK